MTKLCVYLDSDLATRSHERLAKVMTGRFLATVRRVLEAPEDGISQVGDAIYFILKDDEDLWSDDHAFR